MGDALVIIMLGCMVARAKKRMLYAIRTFFLMLWIIQDSIQLVKIFLQIRTLPTNTLQVLNCK